MGIANFRHQKLPMKTKVFLMAFLLSISTISIAKSSFELPVSSIAISPKQKGDFENYIGNGENFELTFITPNQKTPLNAFPETPFYIRNLITKQTCKGGEKGGIWKRDSVYRTVNDKVLILGSYSGSSSALEFYDTKTCEQIDQIEILTQKDPIFISKGIILFKNGLPNGLKKHLNVNR